MSLSELSCANPINVDITEMQLVLDPIHLDFFVNSCIYVSHLVYELSME